MKFREHRGPPEFAAPCIEVADRAALVDHLYRNFAHPLPFDTIQLELHQPRRGEHSDWAKTYVVTLEGYGVIGFTDGAFP